MPGANKTLTVPVVDFPLFLQDLDRHAPPGQRLMKLDIEGSEYQLLPAMIGKQLLCARVLNTVTMEWHNRKNKRGEQRMNVTADVRGMFEEVEYTVMKGRSCKDGPATNIKLFDVEDYLSDGQPLP